MKQIVFVVMYYYYEDTSLLGVFSTREGAEAYIKSCREPNRCGIEEMTIDETY